MKFLKIKNDAKIFLIFRVTIYYFVYLFDILYFPFFKHCFATLYYLSPTQHIVRFPCLCWITGAHTISPPIDELLPTTEIELNPHRFEILPPQ